MKYLVAIILAMVSSVANAQFLGAIVDTARSVSADRTPIYKVTVDSTGPSFEAARLQAFKVAVEYAVGTIIVSEAESRNNRLVRNEIINYSSGFVDRYNIVDKQELGDRVQLIIEVWVSHSAIANRLLNNSSTAGEVQGDRIAVQVGSLQEQRRNGDRLLETVMRDYPNRAFDVKLQPVKTEFDSYRRAILQVPFTISWNKKYLDSLEEVIKNINQFPACSVNISACNRARSSIVLKVNIVATDPGAWFNDDQAWDIMFKNMVLSEPTYRLRLQTTNGAPMVYCFSAPELDQRDYRTHYLVNISKGKTVINGLDSTGMVLKVGLDSVDPSKIYGAELDVVRRSQCR